MKESFTPNSGQTPPKLPKHPFALARTKKTISGRIEPPKPKSEPKIDELSDGLPTVCLIFSQKL